MKRIDTMSEQRFLFGSHVKELRKEQRLTQTQLGLIAGLDRSYISRIERGRCNATLDSILLLASGLGVSASELLDGVSIPIRATDEPLPIALGFRQER